MTSYSSCCRPNRDVGRIERAFERRGKNVVVWELTGNRGYIVSGSERKGSPVERIVRHHDYFHL